ncbi:hypothetical protein [Dickeya solani]|uniref:Uncharacterized protein n=1 Tax=Dickeya solani TaxID=1089444 RepID=A0ABU4E9K3_9GAMM|nr:hypothetical protein [Dickeya solani]MCA6998748.1 hypothetical protein [Dickeya solani]MCZ0822199.1 hypothetical protein [Dickeya solani]MDV6994702.1 hypothetical protein [Dickeya solani]MDV7004081.1 hypothetical protein [Dickeya solani]MDV7039748.1 hypothetical protein [Dickeya solani]
MKLSKEEFLGRNNIDEKSLKQSHLSFEKLVDIEKDYCSKIETFSDTAALFVRTLKHCSSIHSVRWRVKDTENLMEELANKQENKEK